MTQADLGERSAGVSLGPSSATPSTLSHQATPQSINGIVMVSWARLRSVCLPTGEKTGTCRTRKVAALVVRAQSVTAYYTTVSLDG